MSIYNFAKHLTWFEPLAMKQVFTYVTFIIICTDVCTRIIYFLTQRRPQGIELVQTLRSSSFYEQNDSESKFDLGVRRNSAVLQPVYTDSANTKRLSRVFFIGYAWNV